ncbi:MAG: glycosyltransferase [Bacteroidota bacterium]
MPELSIIFGYRNRDISRVDRCLASLGRQTRTDFEIVFVDYGSDAATAKAMQAVVSKYEHARYVYSDTRGWPWNRSRALNIGIRQAKGNYLMTTDVDMVYPNDFVERMLEGADPSEVRHIYHYFLPKGFSDWANVDSNKKDPAGETAFGACHMTHRQNLEKMQGFDEYYCFWGVEDRDVNTREKAMGLNVRWMNDTTYMHHQWHPTVNNVTPGFMPDGWWFKMENHYHRHLDQIVRNGDSWGQIQTKADRPIFDFIDFEKQQLLQQDKVHLLDAKPWQNRSITLFMDAWRDLPSGHVLLMKNAFYPFQKKLTRWLAWLKGANKYTKFLLYDFDISKNLLHRQVYEFCLENADEVSDYYLALPFENGLTLIRKK